MNTLTPQILKLLNSSNQALGIPKLPSMLAPTLPAFNPKSLQNPKIGAGFKGDPNSPLGVIVKNAKRFGLDPAAVYAYALEESSGKYGAVGDQGTSFGPFQAHIGGAAGNRSRAAASAWANSPQGLVEMMGMMSRTPAKGLTGAAAVKAIYQYFGKGTPAAVPRGLARYAEAQKAISQSSMRTALRTGQHAQLNAQLEGQAGGVPTAGWSYPTMIQGTPSHFSNLSMAGHTDWVHVDTTLLTKLNALGHMLGVTIQVISGYRSPNYSSSVGGYSNDPHARGVAVDAYINGVPIGSYKGAFAVLKQLGLESGAQPGFYHGKSDPEHVQFPGSGINKGIHAKRITARR